jgi:hypothetical protein
MIPGGTRIRLYPQAGADFPHPEIVTISPRAGTLRPGPDDGAMHAILPASPKAPYAPPHFLPPYDGALLPPPTPDAAGHLDHLSPGTPQFLAAHLYGAARFTLDVWEGYLGHRLRWWHADARPLLELVPTVDWNNAHSGPGFVETGTRLNAAGEAGRFCLNLDVVAHEIGHAIVFSKVGVPRPGRLTAQYLAFHETMADLVALLTALHFDSVVDRFLAQALGNLYALSVVNRVGELSAVEQIRTVDFSARLESFRGFALRADGTWHDPSGAGRTQHQLSQPLTAAIFSTLIETYQDALVRAGVIAPDDDARGWTEAEIAADLDGLLDRVGREFHRLRPVFHAALAEARDWTGRLVARLLARVPADDLDFATVAGLFLELAGPLAQEENALAFALSFARRDFELPRPAPARPRRRPLSYRERVLRAAHRRALEATVPRRAGLAEIGAIRQLMPHSFRAEPGW